jgi:hypothetical protein
LDGCKIKISDRFGKDDFPFFSIGVCKGQIFNVCSFFKSVEKLKKIRQKVINEKGMEFPFFITEYQSFKSL